MTNLIEKARQAKQRTEEKLSRGGGSGASFWKPAAGENKVRIMPPWADDGEFVGQAWREVAQHWNVSEDQKGPVLCPRNTPDLEGECPICDFVAELKQNKADVNAQALVKEIRAKTTYLLNVVDMKDPVYTAQDVAEQKKNAPNRECPFEVGDTKVQIYACPTTIFDQILGIITSSGKDITQLDGGRTLVITKYPNKDRFKTRYTCQPDLDPSTMELTEGTQLPELDKTGFTMKYEDMVDLLHSGVGGDYVAQLPEGNAGSLPSSTTSDESQEESKEDSLGDLEAKMRAELGK